VRDMLSDLLCAPFRPQLEVVFRPCSPTTNLVTVSVLAQHRELTVGEDAIQIDESGLPWPGSSGRFSTT